MRTHRPLACFLPIPGFRSVVMVLLGVSILSSGCVSLKSVPVPAPGQSSQSVAVQIGDKVHVQTKSGEELAFQVTAVEPETLVGKDAQHGRETRVRYLDIASLQVERVDKVRTGLVIVGTIVVVAGVVAVLAVRSMTLNFGP